MFRKSATQQSVTQRIYTGLIGAAALAGLSAAPPAQAAGFAPLESSPSALPALQPADAQSPMQLAQLPFPNVPKTLAITGNGRAFAPADQAAIIFSYALNYFPEPSSDPSAPPPTPPMIREADLKPIADALISEGISAGDISYSREMYNPQGMRMVVKVGRPDHSRLNRLIERANAVATANNKLISNPAGLVYTVRDCQNAETTARKKAVEDARNRAEALAEATGSQLGDLFNVSEYVTWAYAGPSSSSCPSNLDETLRNATLYGAPFTYDALLPLEVSVDVSVSMTYGLE